VDTAIGVFDSRERAEQAVRELIQHQIPEQAIVFLTRSENEAMSFGKDMGTYAGGFLGGAVGTTAGCVGAALALIPGFGQVFALGVGGAALLGYLGSKAGASIAKGLSDEANTPKPSPESHEDAPYLLEVLKSGKSVVLVQTEYHDVAAAASTVLDRLGIAAAAAPGEVNAQSSSRRVDGISVVDLRGRIAFGDGNTKLRETVSTLTATGASKVVFNMAAVSFIDSSGIGELVRSHMALRKAGGGLKLASVSKPVSDLLHATALDKVFDIHPDESSAILSFEKSAGAVA